MADVATQDDGVLFKTSLFGIPLEYTKTDAAIDGTLVAGGALLGGVGAAPAAGVAALRSGAMMLGRGILRSLFKTAAKEGVEATAKTAAKATVEAGAKAAAKEGAEATAKAASTSILGRPVTIGGTLATHAAIGASGFAAYTGLKVYEHESGGAASTAVFDGTVSFLKEQIAKGISVEDIERKMETLDYIMSVNGAFNKSAQNLYVRGVMNNNEGPDAIKHGKMAAISTQFLPHNAAILFAKHEVRSAIADDMHPGNKDAANKYLAESLVDDIVKNAQVNTLEGNQVSHDDVRKVLTDIMQNPEKHPVASKFFTERGRVTNGLKQIWPELAETPAPSANATTTASLGAAAGAVFNQARDKAKDAASAAGDYVPDHLKGAWNAVNKMSEQHPYMKWALGMGAAYGGMFGGGESRAMNGLTYAMGFAILAFVIEQMAPGTMAHIMRKADDLADKAGLDTNSLKGKFNAAVNNETDNRPAYLPPAPAQRTPVANQFDQASSGKPAPAPAPEDVDLRRNRPEAVNNAAYRLSVGAPA